MLGDDQFSKFTRSINHFINRKWSKVKCSTTIDHQLEEEYETLLREIDYLGNSCYVSFQNNNFHNVNKSSEDLTKILKEHSEEVLKTYITNHENNPKTDGFNNINELVNYVTEIIVSRPKCNHKLCNCKPKKASKEILTDRIITKNNNAKGTQARNSIDTASQKSKNSNKTLKINAEVQTDKWNHDPKCTCGCCPVLSSQVIVKNTKLVQDATTTSDKQTVLLPNCTQTIEEKGKICVSENFETLLSESNKQFSNCVAKKDCACDAYDVQEAIKKGLVLPGNDICIQKKIVIVKEKGTKKKKKYDTSSEYDTPSEISSSASSSTEKRNKSKKNNKKDKQKVKKRKSSSPSDIDSPRKKAEKKEKTTGCFGSKKKKKQCEQYCQGITGRQRSIQTMLITKKDKSEEAHFYGENDRKAVETATGSEKGIQIPDKETNLEHTEDKEIRKSNSGFFIKTPKNKQEETEKPKESMVCDKCGRQRRDCNTACRNTIILPYASRSGGAIPAGEAQSLRMLIKMQSKDTNRQFNNVMNELNNQKSEIRRLNNMYQKMVENFYESQKMIDKNRKKTAEAGRIDGTKSCGCSFDSECAKKKANKKIKTNINDNSYANTCCSCSSEGYNSKSKTKIKDKKGQSKEPLKRYGPPNTAVSINICDTDNLCTGRDKRRKEEFNKSKKLEYKNESSGDSVSTLFINNKTNKNRKSCENIPINIQQILDKIHTIETDSKDDDNPLEKQTNKSTYSSRVLVWLKKSWINLKRKKSECREKEQKQQERARVVHHLFNFCQNAGKQAVVGLWNGN